MRNRTTHFRPASAARVAAFIFLLTITLLASPSHLLAQRGGGRSQPGANSRPVICVHDCREPNSDLTPEEDRRLEHLMAVQATAEQNASFNLLLQDVQGARARLQSFVHGFEKNAPPSLPANPPASLNHPSVSGTNLDQTNLDQTSFEPLIDNARAGSRNFLASFSPEQKSGLKEATKRVETADSDLDKECSGFLRTMQAHEASDSISHSALNLDNALASFQTQQLALAREMSIVLPSDGTDIHFPTARNSIALGGQSVSIPVSGFASRTSSADGQNQFSLRIVADLSDLQQNITGILRSQLASSPRCGERVEIQQAWLAPRDPAGVMGIRLHYERWICPGGSPIELAFTDGTVEIKLTTSIEQNAGVHLASEFAKVDAEGLLRESLLTGSLGDTVREQAVAALLPAVAKGADLKTALPAAAQAATLGKAEFQDAGAGELNLVLDGQLQLSDEQTKQFAAPPTRPSAAPEPAAALPSANSTPPSN